MGKTDRQEGVRFVARAGDQARAQVLEDWLNRHIYHPISRRLAHALTGTLVTPNMVSVAGAITIMGAGAVYVVFDSFWGALLGLVIHMLWHVLDGTDGDLARMTGRASEWGEIVDGVCDYLGHFILYVLLAFALAEEIGPTGWWLMIASGCARAIQTVFYETQKRQYQWWVSGRAWLRITQEVQRSSGARQSALAQVYLRISNLLSGGGAILDKRLELVRPEDRDDAVAMLERRLLPVLRRSMLLSSNYRTLALGIAMMMGLPAYFAVFEIGFLGLVFALVHRQSSRAITSIIQDMPSISR